MPFRMYNSTQESLSIAHYRLVKTKDKNKQLNEKESGKT